VQLIEDNFNTSTSNLGYRISAIRYCDNDYFITQLCAAIILFLCLSLYTSLDGLEKEHGILMTSEIDGNYPITQLLSSLYL